MTPPVLPVAEIKEENAPKGYVKDNAGNPNDGTVFFLRQWHAGIGRNQDRLKKIGSYQFEILKELKRLDIKDVFIEGLTVDIKDRKSTDELYDVTKLIHQVHFVDQYFPDGIPEKPNLAQLMALAEYGAGIVYGLLNKDVIIHRTLEPNEKEELETLFLMGSFNPECLLGLFSKGEEFASKQMKAFFEDGKDKKAAIVFGLLHSFRPISEIDFNPAIYSRLFREEDVHMVLAGDGSIPYYLMPAKFND